MHGFDKVVIATVPLGTDEQIAAALKPPAADVTVTVGSRRVSVMRNRIYSRSRGEDAETFSREVEALFRRLGANASRWKTWMVGYMSDLPDTVELFRTLGVRTVVADYAPEGRWQEREIALENVLRDRPISFRAEMDGRDLTCHPRSGSSVQAWLETGDLREFLRLAAAERRQRRR